MTDEQKIYSLKSLVLLALIITAYRVYFLSLEQFDLFFDEAQYWFWAKNPDWGYYSKPPVVAWIIAATTSICGDGEFCVRLGSPIIHLFTSIAVYFLGCELYNKKVGFYSAVSYITLPAVTVSSALISTDPPLLLFWALSMLFFIKAVRTKRIRWWILTSITAGFGLLSKYNMLIFALSAFIYLLCSKENRAVLKNPWLWIAAIMSLAIFSPNFIWNMDNHFASFMHTKDNAQGGGIAFYPNQMLEFIGAQFGVFGPVLFTCLLIIFAFAKKTMRIESHKYLLLFILPLFVVIVSVSLMSRAHANWAAPIYVPASILVIAWLLEHNKRRLIHFSIILHVILALLATNLHFVGKTLGFEFTARTTSLKEYKLKDPFIRLYGWDELGKGVAVALDSYPDAALLTDSRKIHAEMLYYAKEHTKNAVKWNPTGKIGDHFDLTTDIKKVGTDNFIYVTIRDNISFMNNYFQDQEIIGNIRIKPYSDDHDDYYLYYLTGFKGY